PRLTEPPQLSPKCVGRDAARPPDATATEAQTGQTRAAVAGLAFGAARPSAAGGASGQLFGQDQLAGAGQAQPIQLAVMIDQQLAFLAEQGAAVEPPRRACRRRVAVGAWIRWMGRQLRHDINDNYYHL